MARKLCKKDNKYLAKLVTEKRVPCAFCLREVDDEITFGKLYAIGDIQCHYFCCLLSCCLIQKGPDDEGLFGFMYTDILAEIERCKKHKCSYCNRIGANIGCCVGSCRKQFHLPCGRDMNAISLYYGSYKSFCQIHAPKQKIPEHIMAKARFRKKVKQSNGNVKMGTLSILGSDMESPEEMVCVICYEAVDGFPTINTFWPPCCGKDAWFHRSCLQRMALSAGMHYLKCPLCNDKKNFHDAVVSQGYYVPDRDAAWELEQNAFAEIYERPTSCSVEECLCPMGRSRDEETGKWDIKLCLLCGSAGAHAHCISDQSQNSKKEHSNLDQSQTEENKSTNIEKTEQNSCAINQSEISINDVALCTDQIERGKDCDGLPIDQLERGTESDGLPIDQLERGTDKEVRYICPSCLPAAPKDLTSLITSIEDIIQQEQALSVSNARRPVMPCRMSLRRTKGRLLLNTPSSSGSHNFTNIEDASSDSPNIISSRLELNLKTPRRVESSCRDLRGTDSKLMSPVKLLEQSFREKVVCTGVRDAVLDETVIETLRRKFRKPRPLCEKKRIVNDILDGLFDNLMKDAKKKQDNLIEWCSPKKFSSTVEESKKQTEVNDAPKTPIKTKNRENYVITFNTLANTTDTCKNEKISTNLDDDIKNTKKQTETKTEERDEKLIQNSNQTIGQTNTHQNSNQTSNRTTEPINLNDKSGLKLLLTYKTIETEEVNLSKKTENSVNYLSETKNDVGKEIIAENNNIDNEKMIGNSSKNDCRRHTRSYSSKTISHNNDSCKNDKVKKTDETAHKNDKQKKITRNSTLQSDRTDIKTSLNTPVLKVDQNPVEKKNSSSLKITFKNENLSLKQKPKSESEITEKKGMKPTENLEKKEILPVKLSLKNLSEHTRTKLNRSKTEFKGFPKQEESILKNILLGNDLSKSNFQSKLCSQLLLELTGKPNNNTLNKVNKTLETGTNSIDIETTKSPKSLEFPKNLVSFPENLVQSPNNFPESLIQSPTDLHSPKSSIESTIESQSPLNMFKSPIDIMKSPMDLVMSPIDLVKSPMDLVKSPIDLVKSPIDLVKSPTDLNSSNSLKESRNSSFESTNSLIETQKCKTIDIKQDSSLEISENDQSINIDVIKIEGSPANKDAYKNLAKNIPDKAKVCCFKFSPIDKEILEKNDVGIDLESFKKEYLSEVDREFIYFEQKNEPSEPILKLKSAIEALEASIDKENGDITKENGRKRKFSDSGVRLLYDNSVPKKRKMSVSDLNISPNTDNNDKIKSNVTHSNNDIKKKGKVKRKKSKTKDKRRAKKNKKVSTDNVEVTIDSSEKTSSRSKKTKKKIKTKFAIQNEDIHVKIKWKKKQLSLNIESKKKIKPENSSKFKQYVLQFPEGSSKYKEVLVKPNKEVTCPIKKKHVKQKKHPDKLKQMSIHSFFKLTSLEK